MSRFYIASDFLIVSLIDEPIFSLTVPGKTQTYIAAKKPILRIINGDTAEIIKKNNLGLCAPPSNIDLIYSLIKDCIDMTEEQKAGFVKNNDFLLNSTFNKEKIIILPLFIFAGKHLSKDIPQIIEKARFKHPQIQINLENALGDSPLFTSSLSRIFNIT